MLGTLQPKPAHPRVSGENSALTVTGVTGYGSSPRERGKLTIQLDAVIGAGLIPA